MSTNTYGVSHAPLPQLIGENEEITATPSTVPTRNADRAEGSGATIIFVSHNANAVRDICKRAIWLEKAAIRMDGPAAEVVEKYQQSLD